MEWEGNQETQLYVLQNLRMRLALRRKTMALEESYSGETTGGIIIAFKRDLDGFKIFPNG